MTCIHPSKVIDGIYWFNKEPRAVGWTCQSCRTSGATPWDKATDPDKAEAYLTDMAARPQSPEMMGA